jgi:hypothetical protein
MESPATSGSPTLSLDVTLFFPGCSAGGRTKSRRWADDYGEESDDNRPATYLETARRPAMPITTPPPRTQTRSVVL